ncbi:MAG TPA: gamma-glutamyltransferase [Candidatus Sphingobacterium stercoripullorum]|uniref:Glutathione hydrolase proenzyme n=1 Tax=Candidatus Sphingobacterium stercoripullorum TaxID=2838759 RepID=A0A9D1WAQ6_9SPHI|nr:gamma-glutamyltransferase [Candidatus Sphingobacterium stercoripullorum]
MRNTFYILLLLLLFSCGSNTQNKETAYDPYDYQIIKQHNFRKAAVSSAHPLASLVGKEILAKGGNAIDAAIAVQYALAVVYPNAGNIGGGGFMVVHTKDGESATIDFREKAPAAAFRDMYLDSEGNPIDTKSRDGHLAAGVPGTVKGMELAHEMFGSLDFKELIQPAIDLAEHGFAITAREARGLNRNKKDFQKYSTEPSAFVKESKWEEQDTLLQSDLASTLRRIQDQGAKGFYEGETADLIVQEMERGGGIISLEDLKSYEAVVRDPVVFDYKDYQIISMGLPSSGGILLQQMLRQLEEYPISEYGFQSKESVQLMVEIERRAYADRALYLGDADFVDVPVEALTNKEYLLSRMEDFTPLKASKSEDIEAGEVLLPTKEETTHFSIADELGNVVSLTTTINGAYGNRVVVGGAGFLLNNEMDDFSAKPGSPNKFGLLGAEANAIEPGKRMLSAMTPTVVLKDGKPLMVVGTPGGSTIITSVFQTLVNVLEFGLSPAEAVNSPKFHHQWKPDVIYVEKDYPKTLIAELEEMGYEFKERIPIGRTEVLMLEEGYINAVADKRGDDGVAGY